jgi:outer membrane lipoprotein-sorting protein
MKADAAMSKLSLACALALTLAICTYAPDASAVKVVRDSTPPAPAVPPPRPATTAPVPANLPKLSATQIVDKNVAARGGLTAWRAIQSMSITGKLDAGGKKDTLLPYTLQVKRPNKQRLTIDFAGHTALQVFDGEHGWKLRPYLNRPDPEPFSAEELRKAVAQPALDGPLIDYAAKGSQVELEGTEMVEGQGAYRLKVTSKQGHKQHIWIDGSTFLEAKMEGNPRHFDGQMRKVETYLRDYRRVEGVMLPFVAETRIEGVRGGHSMTIEKAELNDKIDDSAFAKPQALTAATMPAMPKMVTLPAAAHGSSSPKGP